MAYLITLAFCSWRTGIRDNVAFWSLLSGKEASGFQRNEYLDGKFLCHCKLSCGTSMVTWRTQHFFLQFFRALKWKKRQSHCIITLAQKWYRMGLAIYYREHNLLFYWSNICFLFVAEFSRNLSCVIPSYNDIGHLFRNGPLGTSLLHYTDKH